MGKPLLTDEVIAEAQKEENWDKHARLKASPAQRTIYKSRRIENAKRSVFRSKLNRLLWLVLALIFALIYAAFNL